MRGERASARACGFAMVLDAESIENARLMLGHFRIVKWRFSKYGIFNDLRF